MKKPTTGEVIEFLIIPLTIVIIAIISVATMMMVLQTHVFYRDEVIEQGYDAGVAKGESIQRERIGVQLTELTENEDSIVDLTLLNGKQYNLVEVTE